MGKVLIIAEKPSQAQAYANALKNAKKCEGYYEIPQNDLFPDGAYLTYAIGHLITLCEPADYDEAWKSWTIESLPLIPTNSFKFKVATGKEKQFNIIKDLLHKSQEIIIGTDIDREGQYIASLIIKHAGAATKPTKRLWINSLEDEEIIKGFRNLKNGSEYESLAEEAQARQISDWIVGLNASRLYTLLLAKKGVKGDGGKIIPFSVGRVQSPTLKLIYDRQKEIENFKPKAFFELEGQFETEVGAYKGRYKGRFDSKSELLSIMPKEIKPGFLKGDITEVKKELKETRSPQLFSLSSLQMLANKKFKYSPSQVLQIVQELYDNPLKLVTYPRTDTPYITENEFEYLRVNFEGYKNVIGCDFKAHSLEANKRYVNNKNVKEHYAIVPTKKIPSASILEKLTKEQKNIYFEIVKSVLAMFHAPYLYEETTVITKVENLIFETKGNIEKSKGWKELFSNDPVDEDENTTKEEEKKIPEVYKGLSCNAQLNIKEGKTTKPKPFTEGELIPMMRDCGRKLKNIDEETRTILNEVEGLGTEATRSNIIETIKKQNYIEVKKNKVYVTKKGEILCQAIEGTLLAKPELTAKWETYLKTIGKREGNKQTFITNTINFTKSLVENMKQNINELNIESSIQEMQSVDHIAKCPVCKKGFIKEKPNFYGCTEYFSGCKQSFPKKKNEKTITKNQIKQLCEKGKTSKIKGFKKKDSDKVFEAYLEFKDGKLQFSFK